MSDIILDAQHIFKTYSLGKVNVEVLRDVSLTFARGELHAIVGASGSGKSSLLNVLAGLDLPSKGDVVFSGESMKALTEAKRAELRNQKMGFIYQFHHLLPEFTALENVMMPLLIGGASTAVAKQKARDLLMRVGLEPRLSHRPLELSGGERQRVAIARALVNEPEIVFADEPTGNLDSQSAASIQDLIQELNQEKQTTFVVVTHDERFAQSLPVLHRLIDGQFTD